VRLYLVTLALLLVGVSPHRADAQDSSNPSVGPCFEIIAPQRHAHLRTPLLFNKCTGETWLLAAIHEEAAQGRRFGRMTYRWILLEIEGKGDRRTAKEENRVVKAPQPSATEAPSIGAGNCFVFTGRRFCE